jgi:hypothetical protein
VSFRGVGFNGVVRLFGDDALRNRLYTASQRRIKDPTLARRTAQTLMNHKALSFDKGRLAEEKLRIERAKRCRERVERIETALDRGELRFLGLEDTTGHPELTAKKLVGHSVKFLDLDTVQTLLSVERHPNKGKGPVLIQYWVHDEDDRTLRLLREAQLLQDPIITGPMNVFRNGKGEPVDAGDEDSFFKEVQTLFGPAVRKTIERTFCPQESGLIDYTSIPQEIIQCIKLLTGTDISQEEEKAARMREAQYLAKWGPAQDKTQEGVYLDLRGFRLGIERNERPAKS